MLQKLSTLARVRVPESETQNRLRDMNAIVDYISQLNAISIPEDFDFNYYHTNALRSDVVYDANESTNNIILDNFPKRVDDRLAVPQVLNK